jgi:hypothetical protein
MCDRIADTMSMDQVILDANEEPRFARVTLASRAAAQLVIDTP